MKAGELSKRVNCTIKRVVEGAMLDNMPPSAAARQRQSQGRSSSVRTPLVSLLSVRVTSTARYTTALHLWAPRHRVSEIIDIDLSSSNCAQTVIMEAASARYAARDRFGPTFTEPAQTPLQRYIRTDRRKWRCCGHTADCWTQKTL